MPDLRFRLLSARDASAAAARLMDAFADRDRVSCAYHAEATVSAVAGRLAQAGFARGSSVVFASGDRCFFVPVGDLEREGYGAYRKLFEPAEDTGSAS